MMNDLPRWASMDLGTNTFRLLLATEVAPGVLREEALHQRVVRIGEGLERRGSISTEAAARARACLEHFRSLMDAFGAQRRSGAFTAAGRMGSDGEAFRARVETITGASVRIPSGTEEALLSLRGGRSVTASKDSGIFLDIGGGSTEVAVWDPGGISLALSLPTGVVRLWERRTWGDPPTAEDRRDLYERALRDLREALPREPWFDAEAVRAGACEVLATAGTPVTVAAQLAGVSIAEGRGLSGTWVAASELKQVAEAFFGLTRPARAALPAVEPGREDVILAGVAFLESFLSLTGAPGFRVSDGGVLEGILLENVERERGAARWLEAGETFPNPPRL